MNMIHKIRNHKMYRILVNRETIAYAIAGVMTTVVNFISYELMYRLGFSNLNANWIAWLIAVTFAYIVNKWSVFRSKSESVKAETWKVIKFYGARLVSLGVEQLGIYILIERLDIYRWVVKGGLSIIVIILNYIFSKLYIFHKTKGPVK